MFSWNSWDRKSKVKYVFIFSKQGSVSSVLPREFCSAQNAENDRRKNKEMQMQIVFIPMNEWMCKLYLLVGNEWIHSDRSGFNCYLTMSESAEGSTVIKHSGDSVWHAWISEGTATQTRLVIRKIWITNLHVLIFIFCLHNNFVCICISARRQSRHYTRLREEKITKDNFICARYFRSWSKPI